jgi:hypothetical protein
VTRARAAALVVAALVLATAPAAVGACAGAAGGAVLEVGPGRAHAVPSAAARAATDGATVRIAAGDYRGDVAHWTASRLTICGVGGRARLHADGQSAQGKAIWVVSGTDVTIEAIEFHGARVPDRNGAGIRAQHGGALVVRDSGFYDNENGILGGGPQATITIERSEFARNGHGDGYSHNLYVGSVASLTVVASSFREARVGHNLKSRARENRIEYSHFADGPTGESSYLADFPDGGVVVLRGNLFHKGPRAQNPHAIAYGAEGLKHPLNTLTMLHNTVVVEPPGQAYIRAHPATAAITLGANLFAGAADTTLLAGGVPAGRVAREANVTVDAALLPRAGRIESPDYWPDVQALDRLALRTRVDAGLTADSPRPFVLRPLTGPARYAGALQSAP